MRFINVSFWNIEERLNVSLKCRDNWRQFVTVLLGIYFAYILLSELVKWQIQYNHYFDQYNSNKTDLLDTCLLPMFTCPLFETIQFSQLFWLCWENVPHPNLTWSFFSEYWKNVPLLVSSSLSPQTQISLSLSSDSFCTMSD